MILFYRNLYNSVLRYGYFLSFFLLMNAARLILLKGTGVNTYFQADYALIPLVVWVCGFTRCPRWLTACCAYFVAFVAFASDLLVSVGKIFRWGPDAIPQYISSYQDLPWFIIAPTIGSLIILSLLISVLLTLRRQHAFAVWPMLAAIVGLLAVDTRIGSTRFNDGTTGINLITTSIPSIVPVYLDKAIAGTSVRKMRNPTMFSMANYVSYPRQILSVSVESLGLANNKDVRNYIVGSLVYNLGELYEIKEYQHVFFGSTMQGEVRELCGLRLMGDISNEHVKRKLKYCLPEILASKGYDTVAFHGNGPRFYSRLTVYPAMGFRRSWFYDDLKAADAGVVPCPGTLFRGACDARVYKKAVSLFNGRKRFVHVMTLDSHLPLLGISADGCPGKIADDPVVCGYAHVIEQSLSRLADEIRRAHSRPDVIYLYGDHAPPFNSSQERKEFSADFVPFYELRRTARR